MQHRRMAGAVNYGMVRYLYMRSDLPQGMSQMMVPQRRETRLIHDMCMPPTQTRPHTGAKHAMCGVCGRGLYDGYSISAAVNGGRVGLFCDIHRPQ